MPRLKFLLNILAAGLVIAAYYWFVMQPQRQMLEQQMLQRFESSMQTHAMMIDHAFEHQLEAARSMSSRSMIRNKLQEYVQGRIPIKALRYYTADKYVDGAAALNHCLYAARYAGNERIAEFGSAPTTDLLKRIVQKPLSNQASLQLLQGEAPQILVYSPVMQGDAVLGVDLLVFDLQPVLDGIQKQGVQVQITEADTVPQKLLQDNYLQTSIASSSLPTLSFVLSTDRRSFSAPIEAHINSQYWVFGLMLSFSGFILFVLHRQNREVFFQKEHLLKARIAEATKELEDSFQALLEEKKRSEERAKDYQLLADATTEGVARIKNGLIRFVSPHFAARLGKSTEELVGQSLMDNMACHVHADDIPIINRVVQKAVQSKAPSVRFRYRIKQADGSYNWFENVMDMKLGETEQDYEMIIHIRNIQQQVENEELIATQLQELNHLNQEKNDLFALLSHDLRSPLQAISGYLQLLELGEMAHSEDFQTHIKQLRKATVGTTQLLNDLLEWALLSTKKQQVEWQSHPLSELVQTTLASIQIHADKKNINLHTDIVAIDLNTHRPAFNAILRNLLSNAIKFSPEHSTIKVLAKQQVKNLILEVQDEGVGLSIEECELINEEKTALFRSARTSEVHGKGYGLRMSQDFARALGGRLTARIPTDREKGSTFRLTLPLNQGNKEAKVWVHTKNQSLINH